VIVAATRVVLELIVVSLLALAWIVSLFALVLDSISMGAKILWFVALTLLAPIAIPVYLVLRYRRSGEEPASGSASPTG
jgi:hypothetical protein